MLNPQCPIHMDKVHCSTCRFAPNGFCEHARVTRELHEQALRIESANCDQALGKLTERHK